MQMKLISWNVNGLRACMNKGFAEFIVLSNADVICLQETKMQPEQADIQFDGYKSYWNSAQKKGYSGTAVFTRVEPLSVSYDLGTAEHSGEGRVITLEFESFFLVNVYSPNSQKELARLPYRLEWEDAFRGYVKALDRRKPVVICGDMDVVENKKEYKDVNIYYQNLKRFFDLIFSIVGVIVFSPVFILSFILIRATSKGPAIYRQKRVGLKGKLFTIYKFRTMVDGADNLEDSLPEKLIEIYKVKRKLSNDPRVTKVGKVLRRTSIDELPQLFNVFVGNMSLVGPRPMLPDEIDMYGVTFEKYIKVKPGITGYWQTYSRQKTSMVNRAAYDEKYINQFGFVFDLKILLKTIAVVFSKKGAC